MDLDLISPNNEAQINKIFFNLKGIQQNGLVLQIHPSWVDHHGERKNFRFLHCSFSENNVLAVSDSNGNTYIIDLEMQKYWQLPHKGNISALSFPLLLKSKLLVALSTGVVQILFVESGVVSGILVGHSAPVKEISYSYDGKYCLTSNSTEAIIWDLLSCSQAHKLSLKDDVLLKKALFMPIQDSILACFQDDAIHVWKFGTFECFKQILPDCWKTHHLKAIAFTKDGRAMVLGGSTPNVVVFCLDTWTVKRVIELPDSVHGIKHMAFLPQPFDGGANKVLGIVTSSSEICLLDIESSLFFDHLPGLNNLFGCVSVSPNGKYLACVLISGEVDVFITQKILLIKENTPRNLRNTLPIGKTNMGVSFDGNSVSINKKMKQKWLEELKLIQSELKEELSLKKLLPILKQFGEYPEAYRIIIWRSILKIPLNQEAYSSLANKEYHSSYINVEAKYPLVNKAISSSLKRVLSTLAHWCPLFGEVSFLPEFIFPFVKLLHFDPFVCFECVATVIVNWCQNWFEFYPFPPLNVLTMIENVLGHHDSDLLEFYYKKNITSCLYACILMQNAFSEILTKNEWLRLWDHILSNEPSFIYMIVIAYNIICRNAIKKCKSSQEVENFFHNQNAIDLKLLISKSYQFMDKTPSDIHPRRYVTEFAPLKKGNTYMNYESYPKLILERNTAKLNQMLKEEQEILMEQRKTIAMKKELEKKLQTEKEADVREEMLTELEEKFRKIINAEEERISGQRKKLQNLRNELKLKELTVLEELRAHILKKRSQRKETELERLLQDIEAKKNRDKNDLEIIEDEIRKYYSGLILRKCRLTLDLEENDKPMENLVENLRQKESALKNELRQLQDEVEFAYYDKKVELTKKIARITDMLQKLDTEIGHTMVVGNEDSYGERNNAHINDLWKETETFEKKLERFLNKNMISKSENTSKTQNGGHSSKEQRPRDIPTDESYSNAENNHSSKLIEDLSSEKYFTKLRLSENNKTEVLKSPTLDDKSTCHNECRKETDRSNFLGIQNACRENERNGRVQQKSRKLKLRSPFTDCSENQPSCSSCQNKQSTSDESSGDIDTSQKSEYKGVKFIKIKKKKIHTNDRGLKKAPRLKQFHDRRIPLRFPDDDYENDSSSLTSDNSNHAVQLALSERRRLIEEAKRSWSPVS